MSDLLTRAETAERLRCSPHLVSRMLRDGRLRGTKRGGCRQSRVLVYADSVVEHLERVRLRAPSAAHGPTRDDLQQAIDDAETALDRLRDLVAQT